MKLGSEDHKNLFCRSFIESHLEFEPEQLPWPSLDSVALERLHGIPFWREAFCLEENARRMSVFDQQLLQPRFLPTLAATALRILKLIPRRQSNQTAQFSES
ncbi:MAG: hypothetical protein KME30_19550 [Iphinoe sp. HA4291-MV1]|jgi:hypothetical protein|nr:hypothetical protein [Iphinoe sp. HA4291-MV1]